MSRSTRPPIARLALSLTLPLALAIAGSVIAIPATAIAQTFTLVTDPVVIPYDAASGIGSGTITARIFESDLPPGTPPSETDGFSFSLSHDPTLFTIVSVEAAGPVAALAGGNGPFLELLNVFPDGLTGGVIYDALGMETVAFGSPTAVFEFSVETVPSAWSGNLAGGDAALLLADPDQAMIAVDSGIVIDTTSFPLARAFEAVTFEADSTPFIRGDANIDGQVSAISDAITILNGLFIGDPLFCRAAADINADGGVNLADAITLLNYGFTGGAAPPAPFPDCGFESIQTTILCDQSGC